MFAAPCYSHPPGASQEKILGAFQPRCPNCERGTVMDVALDRRAWNVKVERPTPHPRTIGWVGTAAMAMGGSNQSLFLMAALFVGQGDILGQGSAAVPLLIFGLLLG